VTKDWVYACDKSNSRVSTTHYELNVPPSLTPQPSTVVTHTGSTGSHHSSNSQYQQHSSHKHLRAAGRAAAAKIQRATSLERSDSDSDTQPMNPDVTAQPAKKRQMTYKCLHSDSDSDTQPMNNDMIAKKPTIQSQDLVMTVNSDSGSDTEPMDDTEAVPTAPVVPPPPPPPTPLPSFFEELHFVLIGSFPQQQKRLLNRYITAYNGYVAIPFAPPLNCCRLLTDVITPNTTHAVIADDIASVNRTDILKACPVRAAWVSACHQQQCMVDTKPYTVNVNE